MDNDTRSLYASKLITAYQSNYIKIIWGKSGFSLSIDPKYNDLIPELKEKKFIEYAFSIVKIVISIVEGKDISHYSKDDIELAKKISENEYELKNHLYLKKNSTIDTFKLLEYNIISHRNSDNPNIIEANSAIIKVVTEKDDNEHIHIFELSKRDICDILNVLTELKDKIDSL